jgi:vancomycin resistance protein VanJ
MTATPPPRRSPSRWPIALLLLWLMWVIGQFVRDTSWWTALAFYFPSPLLTALLVFASIALGMQKRYRIAGAMILLASIPAVMTLFVENRPFAMASPTIDSEFRIVHWNVGGRLRSPGGIDVLAAQSADLFVISEAGPSAGIEKLRARLGEQYHAMSFDGLAVISADSVRLGPVLLKGPRTIVQLVEWNRPDRPLRLMVVDLPSNLSVPRDPLLQAIRKLIAEHRPDLVIGDFNAPRRSRALSALPVGYRHAYDVVGRGCGYTWPTFAPMLAIDHCLIGPGVTPVRYELRTSWSSDHRLQAFDGGLRRDGP